MRPLEQKVTLLIDTGSNCGCSLALELANFGAIIALVFDPRHAEEAHETKRRIEALGGRVLIIPDDPSDPAFSEEVMSQTINEFGQIDIFIDYSNWFDERGIPENHSIQDFLGARDDQPRSRTGINVMTAVLSHMLTTNQMHQTKIEANNQSTRKGTYMHYLCTF